MDNRDAPAGSGGTIDVQHRPVPIGTTRERTGVTVASDRFLQLADVAEILNISSSQTYALVRSGELPAIKVGGRGQWRVERARLEAYIEQAYQQTATWVKSHPLDQREVEESVPSEASGRS